MMKRDLRTREVDDDSHEYFAQPRPPTNRPPSVFAAVAVLLLMALGAAIFGVISTRRTANRATGASSAHTPTANASRPTPFPTRDVSSMQPPRRGTGLPKGVEVFTFMPTGSDEGWGTGGVITNLVTGFPDRSMVLHYAAGSWTQVGPALSGINLLGIDMISSSEGWAMGGNDSGKCLLLHITGGAWQQEPLPAADPNASPAVMAMRTPDEGWMAMANQKQAQGGANTSLFHYTGGVWSLIPNPIHFITDIAPIADGEAWVIGWNTDGTSSLVRMQGGNATVEFTSQADSTFDYLRVFAPNDIWIEGEAHDPKTNLNYNDVPLNYHFNGVAWSKVNLRAPKGVQHIGIVTSESAWGFAIAPPSPGSYDPFGKIASIYSNAGGQWQALGVPYKDLQTLEVVSKSGADVWAVGVYMVTTPTPIGFSGVSHYVLLRYADGAWTEYGR